MKRPHGRQTRPAQRRRSAPPWVSARKWQRRIQRSADRAAEQIARQA